MSVSAGVVTGVAWMVVRDTEAPTAGGGVTPSHEYLSRAASFSLRLWLLFLGGGVPSAIRTLQAEHY